MSDLANRIEWGRSATTTSFSARGPALAAALAITLAFVQVTRLESQSIEQFRVRLDSLRVEWEERRNEFLDLAGELAPREIDTIEVGPFTVLADAPIGGLLKRAVPTAWATLRETLGSDSMLAAAKLLYFPTGRSERIVRSTEVVAGPWISEHEAIADVVNRIVLTVGEELGAKLDEDTRLWLGANIMGSRAAERSGWSGTHLSWVYVELATAGSSIGRRCFAGDLSACNTALELEPTSDPLIEWYDAHDRRRLIARTGGLRGWVHTPQWIPCVDEGNDTDCEELLRDRMEGSTMHPVSPRVHQTLVETAVEMGGDGAFGRMLETEAATIGDWIAAVAQTPSDAVVAKWHADVIASRPAPTTLTAATGWGAVAWILVLAAIATRSTRWRA